MSIVDDETDEFLFIDSVHFHHYCMKDLTVEEASSSFLVCSNFLPISLLFFFIVSTLFCYLLFPFPLLVLQFLHIGFCQIAFSPATASLTLINFRGRKWKCKFQWTSSRPGYCCISDGWPTFRGLNGLIAGTSLKLGVAQNNKKYLFVKVV